MALFANSYYTERELVAEGFRQLGTNVRIAPTCTIVAAHNISIGDNVRIDGYCTIVAAGERPVSIGSFVHIGGYCALLAAEGLTMGDFSTLSWGVKLFTRSDDFSGAYMTNPMVPARFTLPTRGAVVLGRHVVVGAGSILLPGIDIGEGAAVGAMSLVRGDLRPWTISAGIPAKLVKQRQRGLLDLEKAMSLPLAPPGQGCRSG